MAVEVGADPIDVALDRIATISCASPADVADALAAALTIATLWRQVFEGAMRRSDAPLASIASREHRRALSSYREIERISDLRAPPI